METLQYATPLGLALDVVGFLLVVRYGHSLFLRFGTGVPDSTTGKDGDLYFEVPGPRTVERGGAVAGLTRES